MSPGPRVRVVTDPLVRYRSEEEDSARWWTFPFRPDDIVISARSKSGTTWVQMICALLVFQTPDLPERLDALSPWLDWLVTPQDQLFDQLEAQSHRRFIKTHTPLDGVPDNTGATYIVVGRHPLDMAVSLYHQGDNIDRLLLHELTGALQTEQPERPELGDWLRSWIAWSGRPEERLDSLPGVMWHLSDAWMRRDRESVLLVHYDDLVDDLEGEMRRMAVQLDIAVSEDRWPDLVNAASFDTMRDRAEVLAPGPVLRDRSKFFRRGTSGAGAEALSAADIAAYEERAHQLAPPDLITWVHRPQAQHRRSTL